jgi:hypothetical protein
MVRSVVAAAVAVLASACTDPDLRTVRIRRVEPGLAPLCGAPPDARQVIVTALGEFAVAPETATSFPVGAGVIGIDRFPDATRALTVQVLGLGGDERAVGRTAELAVGELAQRDELSVFMAPRRGTCPVGGLARARIAPLAARAGELVLVAGGADATGGAVPGAEVFDPAVGRFAAAMGDPYGDDALGLTGATLTALGGGRALLAGGPRDAFQVFVGADRAFEPPRFLGAPRARHAALALPDGSVLLAGGCAALDAAGACLAGSERLDSSILDLRSGAVTPGPALASPRLDGAALVEAEGRVLLVAGVDADGVPVTRAERLYLAGEPGDVIEGPSGALAPLASGAALVGFGADAPDRAWVIPAGAGEAVEVSAAGNLGARAGASLTALDDGAVLVAGGAIGAALELAVFVPFDARFTPFAATEAPTRREHAAVLLADGGVLLVGGRGADGAALADAWIYRHDLTSRFTSAVAIDIGDTPQALLLSPSNPALIGVEREAYRLRATGEGLGAYAVVGGPRFLAPRIAARIRAGAGGGAAVIAAFDSPSRLVYAALLPGVPPRLVARERGRERLVCAAERALDAAALTAPSLVELAVTARTLALALDGRELLACELAAPLPEGRVGIGALGPADVELVLETLAATR